MRQWFSSSLFRRLFGMLLFGLMLAQALNRALHLYEHQQVKEQSRQVETAKRVADIVRLISPLNDESKRVIAEQIHDPFLHIQLAQKTSQLHRTGEPNNPKFKLFHMTLNALLGQHKPIWITITETLPHKLLLHIHLKDGTALIMQTEMVYGLEEDPSLLLHLLIILAVMMGFSFVAVRWVTRPLQELADAAEKLGNDIHKPPLKEDGPIEVSRAAHAFNIMQERLIHHIQQRTQLLAAISHDLKTPITRLRLRTELLDDDALRQRFQKDLDEMESMVMATLDFMHGVDQQEVFQQVDMMALLESLQADAQEMQEQVIIEGGMHAPYKGKPTALKRCISNLLDNAFKYGKRATLLVEDSADACIIRILDDGPGIPEEQIQNVFTPFYRLESSRNRDTGGTGLGLSIAQEIAHNHGGRLTLKNKVSGGLEAILVLARNQ